MKRITSNKGFTLIELLISIAIGLIVITGIVKVASLQQKSQGTQTNIIDIQENLRAGLVVMSVELSMASYSDPIDPIYTGILSGDADTIRFSGDFDSDGDLQNNETIEYNFVNGERRLTREEVNGSDGPVSLAENIESVDFQYFDGNDDQLGLPLEDDPAKNDEVNHVTKVRKIIIELTASVPNNVVYGGGASRTLTMEIKPRNIGGAF